MKVKSCEDKSEVVDYVTGQSEKRCVANEGNENGRKRAREEGDGDWEEGQEGVDLLVLVAALRDADEVHGVPNDAVFECGSEFGPQGWGLGKNVSVVGEAGRV